MVIHEKARGSAGHVVTEIPNESCPSPAFRALVSAVVVSVWTKAMG